MLRLSFECHLDVWDSLTDCEESLAKFSGEEE